MPKHVFTIRDAGAFLKTREFSYRPALNPKISCPYCGAVLTEFTTSDDGEILHERYPQIIPGKRLFREIYTDYSLISIPYDVHFLPRDHYHAEFLQGQCNKCSEIYVSIFIYFTWRSIRNAVNNEGHSYFFVDSEINSSKRYIYTLSEPSPMKIPWHIIRLRSARLESDPEQTTSTIDCHKYGPFGRDEGLQYPEDNDLQMVKSFIADISPYTVSLLPVPGL